MNSIKKSPYPFFIPPGILGTKNRREWSVKEAKAYFQWLMECTPVRIEKLLEYFGEANGKDHEGTLFNLGKKISRVLPLEEFSTRTASSMDLTDRGYALAADMGLLIGQMLIKSSGSKIKWAILTKPRNDISFNFPVLAGFTSGHFDPIQASIAQIFGVLEGTKDGGIWQDIYDKWKEQIPA